MEFDPKFEKLISRIDKFAPNLEYLSIAEAIVKYPKPQAYL